jgi:hypothetical protein
LLLGASVGVGQLYYTKKSQRESLWTPLLAIGAFVGGIIGLGLGAKFGRSRYVEDILGHSDAETTIDKDGRFWYAATIWSDKRNGKKQVLITGKSNHGVLASALNDRAIINHEINSASRLNVEKYHREAKKKVFRHIENNFTSIGPVNIDDLFSQL